MKKNLLLSLCFAFLGLNFAHSQLNGTYSVDNGSLPSATNYVNIASAVSDMMAGTRSDGGTPNGPGVSGPVIIRLAAGSGPYTEQITIGAIPGASAVNTVRITGGPNRQTIQFTATTVTNQHVIRLSGTRHLTLDSLTIVNNGATYGYGVHITTGADSNVVENSIVTVNAVLTSTNFAGITISGTTVASDGNWGDDNIIQNNTINGGYYGISMRGSGTLLFAQRNSVINNVINDSYFYGIYCYYENLTSIVNNQVYIRTSALTTSIGIYLYYSDRFVIEKNNVQKAGSNGIYTYYGNYQQGVPGTRASITNNMVGGGFTNTTPYGIYITTNSNNIDIWHNSVSLDFGNGRALYITGGTGNDVRNNSFSCTGSTTGYAMYITSATNVNGTSSVNYNNYYVPGSSNFIYVGAAYTPGNYLGGGGYNINSRTGNPNYVNAVTNLHITNGVQLYDAGINLGVTSDIDNNLRPLPPSTGFDMGADEYLPSIDDAGITALNAPVPPVIPGINNVDVTMFNYGASSLTSATINWTVNGVPQTPFPWSGLIVSFGSASGITIGSYNFLPATAYTLRIWSSNPNGFSDNNFLNDTLTVSMCAAYAGTYTIGGFTPDFTSMTDAVTKLTCGGVSGPVTVNFAPGSGPYTEQVTIPFIPGASATNTIRFNGGSSLTTVQFALTTVTNQHTIRLSGAKHIILDSMTILNTGATYGYGVHITNNSDSNRVQNCVVTVSPTGTSVNFAGITISGTTVVIAGDWGDDNLIQNNTVNGGYYGITMQGTSTLIFSQRNKVINNTINNSYYNGVYASQQNLTQINDNDIFLRSPGTTASYGIYINYVDRFSIERNNIKRAGTYGIYLNYANNQGGTPTSRASIINNMIGGGFTAATPYGMYITTNSRNMDIWHNSISLDFGNGRAINLLSGTGNDLRNNSCSIVNSTTGYALYVTSTTYVNAVDYNNYYTPGSSNFIYIAVPYTPATYVGGGGFNTNSRTGNPNYFSNANNLHVSTGIQLYNAGTNLGVNTDIDGDTRPMPPTAIYDIGADEHNAAPADAGVTALNSPVVPFAPGLNNVSVTVRNYGADTLSSAIINWRVNGALQAPFPWTGTIVSGTSLNGISIGNYSFILGTTYTLQLWTSAPNGSSDANMLNDSLTVTFCPGYSGTYTIGGTFPDFINMSDAAAKLGCGGVYGPVTCNFAPGQLTFFEQVTIPVIPGASPINTVRFNGGTTYTTVRFGATTFSDRHVIRLSGCRHVTLDSLKITNSSPTYGWGVHITNAADSNTIKNCIVTVDTTLTAQDFAGIVISGPGLIGSGDWGDDNQILNNTINGGYYGTILWTVFWTKRPISV